MRRASTTSCAATTYPRPSATRSMADSSDRIFERLDLAAVVAHEVVVMVAARMCRLEARHAVSEVDPLDETELVHALERSVDARDPDPIPSRTHELVNLLGREAAVLLTQ